MMPLQSRMLRMTRTLNHPTTFGAKRSGARGVCGGAYGGLAGCERSAVQLVAVVGVAVVGWKK
jgi:hypothetical protein